MTPTESKPAAGEVNTKTAAMLLMITPARVGQIEKEGYFAKAGRDRYRLIDLVQGFIKYLRDDARRNSASAASQALQAAKAREVEARVAEREKRQERAGQQAALDAVDDLLPPLKADLFAIPARATADLATRRKVEDLIDAAIAASGDRARALAAKIEAGKPPGGQPAESPAHRKQARKKTKRPK